MGGLESDHPVLVGLLQMLQQLGIYHEGEDEGEGAMAKYKAEKARKAAVMGGSSASSGTEDEAALAALEARNAIDRAVYERAARAFDASLRKRRPRRRNRHGDVL